MCFHLLTMAEPITLVQQLVMAVPGALLGFIMVNLFQDTGENAFKDAQNVISNISIPKKCSFFLIRNIAGING